MPNPAHKGIKVGDRLWWENEYGQQFRAAVVRIHGDSLYVKRDEWYGEESLDLRKVVRSLHFPHYRGWRIEKVEGFQVGHKTNAGLRASLGLGTHRKIKGYEVYYPDGGTKILDTLKEAKAYIDEYIGQPETKETDDA